MPFPNYIVGTDTPAATVSLSDLHAEIVAAGPYDTTFGGVSVSGNALVVEFEVAPGAADITAIEVVLAAHDHTLEQAKQLKIAAIDGKTSSLIAGGFTYSAKQFSLSIPSQSKMTAAHQIKDNVAFVYPVKWNSIDDTDVHSIPDAADMDAFYLTAIAAIRAHLDSGTALKDAVRAAVTVAAVDAVVDAR